MIQIFVRLSEPWVLVAEVKIPLSSQVVEAGALQASLVCKGGGDQRLAFALVHKDHD